MRSSTPARRAAMKHSWVSAASPLTITLRTILIAAAAPTSAPTSSTSMPQRLSSVTSSAAVGPETSTGVLWRSGCTGAITAMPTKRARLPTIAPASRLRLGETELSST
jgi:hypothetical protein